jgi:Ran GTPase-activating protein (RanGAP) involved in mRNA processing and transport
VIMSVVIAESKKIFEFSGGREAVVTAEKAEALIQAIDVKDPSHIHLSNKSFSSEAAICIAKRLSTFKKIEIADISDIIAGRAFDTEDNMREYRRKQNNRVKCQ